MSMGFLYCTPMLLWILPRVFLSALIIMAPLYLGVKQKKIYNRIQSDSYHIYHVYSPLFYVYNFVRHLQALSVTIFNRGSVPLVALFKYRIKEIAIISLSPLPPAPTPINANHGGVRFPSYGGAT